ncbi:unnamed protein product [Sphagnum troendelagicum]|uniref:MIS12 homologue n=1 Tax=Sphagnum troendelagicum TaxID=128251 RepID=A0ABP0TZX1_9BRYO
MDRIISSSSSSFATRAQEKVMSAEDQEAAGVGGEGGTKSDTLLSLESLPALYPVHYLAFDSQAFIDDVINAVIQISTEYFDQMEVCSRHILGLSTEESQAALAQGMGAVTQHFLTQVIDNDLTEWEKYCHEVSFTIPHGLVLPEKHELMQIMSGDEEAKLDAELASLRARKAAAETEAAKKRTELRALETLLTFKSAFDDDFEQLRSHSLKDDLLNAAPMLCDKIRQANVLRAQRFGRFPRQPF